MMKAGEYGPVLNEGLAIQTLIQAIPDILTPTQRMTSMSASHSQPGLTSSHQNIDILHTQTTAE